MRNTPTSKGIDLAAEPSDDGMPGRLPNDPNLLDGGVPGHDGSNAGRPKKLTAEALANEAGEYSEDYTRLHRFWLDQAFAHLKAGETRLADMASKRAESIQETNVRYGVGSKSTNVLGIAGTLDACESAYLQSSDLASFLKALEKQLKWDSP